MSAPARMTPLERRYRRLVRVLPAEHRAARGEELIGLLLDLDEGRRWPSFRQAVGVVGLALPLRLAAGLSLLLAALLVVYSTVMVADVYTVTTGAMTVEISRHFYLTVGILTVLRVAIAVAWIVGARRVALAPFAPLLAFNIYHGVIIHPDVVVLVFLAIALVGGWPAPRPRVALLASIPIAMLLWTVRAASNTSQDYDLLLFTAGIALFAAVGGLFARPALSRR